VALLHLSKSDSSFWAKSSWVEKMPYQSVGVGDKDFGHIITILLLIERSYQPVQTPLVGFFSQSFNLFKSGVSQASPDSFQRNDFTLGRAFFLIPNDLEYDQLVFG
jgi:hypothetical protein